MSKTYNPGPEADAIIERQLARGNYGTPDEVVRAGVRLLEEHEAELEELRKLIDEGDAAHARGDYTTYTSADQFLTDITVGRRAIAPKILIVTDPASLRSQIASFWTSMPTWSRSRHSGVPRDKYPPGPSPRRSRPVQPLFSRYSDRNHPARGAQRP